MNAKEAKEIISIRERDSRGQFIDTFRSKQAEGYIAALKGPEVLALVQAVENLSKHWSIVFPKNNVIRSGSEYLMEKVDEALARYREEVKK